MLCCVAIVSKDKLPVYIAKLSFQEQQAEQEANTSAGNQEAVQLQLQPAITGQACNAVDACGYE